jgi:hypothetical protein
MGPQVPSAPWPFFIAEHATQTPEHAVSQQMPSTQFIEAHCVSVVHVEPLGRFVGVVHPPEPLQSLFMHSLSGSVPVRMTPQVPLVPWPFFAAVQAWHKPGHAPSQQTPSVQKPDVHCVACVQAAPFGCCDCG